MVTPPKSKHNIYKGKRIVTSALSHLSVNSPFHDNHRLSLYVNMSPTASREGTPFFRVERHKTSRFTLFHYKNASQEIAHNATINYCYKL